MSEAKSQDRFWDELLYHGAAAVKMKHKTEAQELAQIEFAQRGARKNMGVHDAEELVKMAIERHGDKVAVGWSGGRCSTVVLNIAHGIKRDIKVLFEDTGVEYSETTRFVKELAEKMNLNLITAKPDITFWAIVKKYGFPKIRNPKNKTPKCCYYLKEKPLKLSCREHGIEALIDGIRVSESRVRALSVSYHGQFHFTKHMNIWKYHPIAFWTTEQLKSYEWAHNLPINPAYKKYNLDRTGCWPCTGYLSWERNMLKTHPKFYATLQEKMGTHILDHFFRTHVDEPPCHTEAGG